MYINIYDRPHPRREIQIKIIHLVANDALMTLGSFSPSRGVNTAKTFTIIIFTPENTLKLELEGDKIKCLGEADNAEKWLETFSLCAIVDHFGSN